MQQKENRGQDCKRSIETLSMFKKAKVEDFLFSSDVLMGSGGLKAAESKVLFEGK
jgi:hypothetical protein